MLASRWATLARCYATSTLAPGIAASVRTAARSSGRVLTARFAVGEDLHMRHTIRGSISARRLGQRLTLDWRRTHGDEVLPSALIGDSRSPRLTPTRLGLLSGIRRLREER